MVIQAALTTPNARVAYVTTAVVKVGAAPTTFEMVTSKISIVVVRALSNAMDTHAPVTRTARVALATVLRFA